MKNIIGILSVVAGVFMLTASACTEIDDPNTVDHSAHLVEDASSACVLDFVNSPRVDVDTLDIEVGLDRRAATNLVAYRNGVDGVRGTADDRLYASVGDIARMDRMGQGGMRTLTTHADAWCYGTPGQEFHGVFDGVAFSMNQAEMTLTVVNTLEPQDLAWVLEGNDEALDAVLTHREIMSLDELAALPGVDRRAMTRIRVEAMR